MGSGAVKMRSAVIHGGDVDEADPRPNGQDRAATKRYPSDLTDAEWERIAPLLPKVARRGHKPRVDRREILNAIRYMARSGGGWRMLPKDFPP